MQAFADSCFVLAAFIFTRTYTLECYQCSHVDDLNTCNVSRTCNTGETCFTNAIPNQQGVIYDLGCIAQSKCSGGLTVTGSIVGKRQMECHECCSRDLCNQALCLGLKSASNCLDDEQEDCARLESLFRVCNDVPHARLICPRFCNLCGIVDGGWSDWSVWSDCDVTCANGTQSRTRYCNTPVPSPRGEQCKGHDRESTICTNKPCPIHGGWTRWSVWGSCSVTCDIGMQRRDRSCSNPYPSADGDFCRGDARDDRMCIESACANGAWSTWSVWNQCSVTCGTGLQSRQRQCDNPKPSPFGTYCIGSSESVNICFEKACDALSSAFSVSGPKEYHSSLSFSQFIYHIGSDFNINTGVLTCTIPGIYIFSTTLVKGRASTRVDRVYCYIYQNDVSRIRVWVDPTDDDTDKGNAAVTQTVVLHLNLHDRVYLGSCTPTTTMESWTSFSGFLLTPDS